MRKRGAISRGAAWLVAVVLALTPTAVGADDPAALARLSEQIEQLRELIEALQRQHARELAELRADYERRLRELERRIAELQGEAPPAAAEDVDEIEALRREAEAAAAEAADDAEAPEPASASRQRSLQALNPEISFLGDVSYDWTDDRTQDRFLLRGAEISFQAALDPYTRFRGYLGAHQEAPELPDPDAPLTAAEEAHGEEISVALEESYMEWVALPLGARLRVGLFRQQFGTLNRWHEHALPSVDVPLALQRAFGDEGLVGLGVGFELPIPRFWADANRVIVEVVNADNDVAFAGSSFRDPSLLLRHTGFFDLGGEAYFEIGLSGLLGPNDELGRDTTVGGVDVNFVWEPAERARYRGLELRGELLGTRFETAAGPTVESTSFYAYATWKLAQRWSVGLRHDDAELPWDRFELYGGQSFREGLRESAWSPFLTFWQSEYVRLRLQYQHVRRDFVSAFGGDGDDRLWFQVTFAAGPHKHEAY